MWFKNLCPYRLMEPFELSAEQLEERLAAFAYTPCGSLDMQSRGWVPPLGKHGEQLVHAANGAYLICLQQENKLLPASVVREDRKSTRLNSSHVKISYAVFCLKKKK